MIPRRRFLTAGLASALVPAAASAAPARPQGGRPLTLLHLTDLHIRPEHDAPARCASILRKIRAAHRDIDLVLNTGDSIYAADYKHITRERVLEQWDIWDRSVMPGLKGLPMIHAIGNHDPWWAGEEGDEMKGIPYVCKRLGIDAPFSASRHGGWEVRVLDNSRGSIDAAQRDWLFESIDKLPAGAPLLIASHVPLYSLAGDHVGGNMSGAKAVVEKLAARQGPVVALSGHIHVQSSEAMWNIRFHCNGALSGSWWEPGDAGDGSYQRTPAGYAIVRLWPDGRSESVYHPLPA